MKQATRRALSAKLKALMEIPTECLTRKQALNKLNIRIRLNREASQRRNRTKLHVDDLVKVGHSVTQ